ncbi:MAG: neutral/alkaline non-lysosomal ceramidase N-terminal domain-containing protein, partial [Pseudomonadota bacterium]
CHAEKQWLLSQAQPLFMAPGRFPHLAAIQVLRINELALVTLPWEISAEAGKRISQRVAATLQERGLTARVVVAGNANGYFGYATTPEEYSAQYYEGGQTLYGPGTTEFLARQSARLAGEILQHGNVSELPENWSFPLVTRIYWPPANPPLGKRELVAGPIFVPGDGTQEPYWSVTYRDADPGTITLDEPLISIEALREPSSWVLLLNNGRPMNDTWQQDLQIRWLQNEDGGMARYELRWLNPPSSPNFRFRFAIKPRAGLPAWQSPPFPR